MSSRALAGLLAFALCRVSSAAGAHTGELVELPTPPRVLIPAGWFTFGASTEEQNAALLLCRRDLTGLEDPCNAKMFAGEGPPQRLFLPAFRIDRREVSIADYRACVATGACDPRPLLDADPRMEEPRLPVTRVSWLDADRYCRHVGGRLPTEREWERAARGPTPRIFPWGDAPLDGHANTGRFVVLDAGSAYARIVVRVDERDGHALLSPPGAFPSGASPDGVLDLAGNVSEWVADRIGEDGPSRKPGEAPPTGTGRRLLRGGSFRQPLLYQRTTAWESAPPDLRSPEVGFRCATARAIEPR